MSAELAGPLPTVRFHGGPRSRKLYASNTTDIAVPQALPTSTLDLRFAACTDHHVACDCREAVLAEEYGEARAELTAITEELARATEGHAVRVWTPDGNGLSLMSCKCPLCVMLRNEHLEHLVPIERAYLREGANA